MQDHGIVYRAKTLSEMDSTVANLGLHYLVSQLHNISSLDPNSMDVLSKNEFSFVQQIADSAQGPHHSGKRSWFFEPGFFELRSGISSRPIAASPSGSSPHTPVL
jgi:hypothetical protein